MYNSCTVLCFLWWLFNRDMMYDKNCVLTMFASFIPYEPLNNLIEKKVPWPPTPSFPQILVIHIKGKRSLSCGNTTECRWTSNQPPKTKHLEWTVQGISDGDKSSSPIFTMNNIVINPRGVHKLLSPTTQHNSNGSSSCFCWSTYIVASQKWCGWIQG